MLRSPAKELAGGGSHTAGLLLRPAPAFRLPPELEAHAPPEARGLARDEVRLMVSCAASDAVTHARFRDLPRFLDAGDLLVINTSATLKAALPVSRADGTALTVHLSTRLPDGRWIVELRRPDGVATQPFRAGRIGERLALPAGGTLALVEPYGAAQAGSVRLWRAELELQEPLHAYLEQHGAPIRYGYVPQSWPIDAYQTVYAAEPGSAEMPSAGRAFSHELITRLVAQGVQIAPLVLHTGVASLEDHEPPYEEFFRVPATTAEAVNAARQRGQRVIAVGTTAVRALESATDVAGVTHAAEGWTTLVITPDRQMRAVNGLLTGLHEPQATHLAMLESLAGPQHISSAYTEALRERYLWHEFGDLHLILP